MKVYIKDIIGHFKLISSYHIAAIFLSVLTSACAQRSDMLFLDPSNAIISATSVHQQKKFALDVLFVVESSNNNFSSRDALKQHIGYLSEVLLSQKEVIDLHIGFTMASTDRDIQVIDEETSGFEFFSNENSDEMFPFGVFYVETLERILEMEDVNNRQFFDAVSRVLTSDTALENEFYRDEANLLLVFIGEDDQSENMNVDSLTQKALELKKYEKDKINVLSIYPIFNKCSSSDDLSVQNLKAFAEVFSGHVLYLCNPIFNKLLQVAQVVYQNVASISLTGIPLLETVTLCYGSRSVSQNALQGWSYLPRSNRIALAWDAHLSPPPKPSEPNEVKRLDFQTTRDSAFRLSCDANKSDPSSYLFDLTYMSTSPSNIAKTLLTLKEKPEFLLEK